MSKVTMIDLNKEEEINWEYNHVYLSQREVTIGGAKLIRKCWDAEYTCKKAKTAMKWLINDVEELSWMKDFDVECAEANNMLSSEYDSFTIEQFEDTVYIAACMFVEV